MNTIEVKVPDIGDFKDVPVIEIFVKPGDIVAAEDSLLTLESDKATMDVPAPSAGKVKEVHVKLGDKVSEGALIVGGKTISYYNVAAGSIGLQLGVQQKSQVILFMNESELAKFRKSEGWKAGVDGSVALATLGAGGQIDTETSKKPIIGFIFSNKGLMYNLTFEGSKISKIDKD